MTTRYYAVVLLLAAAVSALGETSTALTSHYREVLRGGDAKELAALLQSGADVNARDHEGNTPLLLASAYGTAESVRVLLDKGADANLANGAGATPLMRAADDGEKVRLLLDHGARVQVKSVLGNTPLHLAARTRHSHGTVKLLLEKGADPNATNNWGATPLMAAAAGGDLETARLLIKAGADVNAQPGASHEAFILGGARNALAWASFRGNLEMMELLLDSGANVNEVGMLGTALTQAVWAGRTAAAQLLLERGAKVDLAGPMDGYTPLHWAASSEERDASLVNLLLQHGANPNAEGGENVDAFLGTVQTPLMLARRRGDGPVLNALLQAGASKGTPDRQSARLAAAKTNTPITATSIRAAIDRALVPLQHTSLASKEAYLRHGSKQDCVSCHQQYLPMAALGAAKQQHARIDRAAEERLLKMVGAGELKSAEADWEALFHPDAVQTKGYTLFAYALQGLPASEMTDAWVHHLAAIQGQEGEWHNNLPRPPIQTGDIGATALAIQGLQRYALPGRKAAFAEQVEQARQWLLRAKPGNTDGRVYQLLGLGWAGESAAQLRPLAEQLLAEQREDGGWAQLPGLKSDAYATGQTLFALRLAAGLDRSHPAVERGLGYLLSTQEEDGTWHVRRRAFPFQPTMDSGFPHGRDSWISAAASSWAVMALSVAGPSDALALKP